LVVQPGAEFGDATIHEHDRAAANELASFINCWNTADVRIAFQLMMDNLVESLLPRSLVSA
jgi:hypothetical protein